MRALNPHGLTLSVDAGEVPPAYLPIAGLRLTKLQIVNEGVELGQTLAQSWRKMLSGGGLRRVSVEAGGLLVAGTAALRLQALGLSGEEAEYRMLFEQGRELRGRFIVMHFGLEGLHGEEATCSLRLESSGDIALA